MIVDLYNTGGYSYLALEAVKNACLNVKNTEGIILHSDLGSQYTSELFPVKRNAVSSIYAQFPIFDDTAVLKITIQKNKYPFPIPLLVYLLYKQLAYNGQYFVQMRKNNIKSGKRKDWRFDSLNAIMNTADF